MSFEFSRVIGRAGSLLIVSATVAAPMIVVIAFFLRLLQNTLLFAVFFSLFSYSVHILFLISMKRFAKYFQARAIFRNALYGFITALVGSFLFLFLTFGAFSYLRDFVESIPRSPSMQLSIFVVLSFIAFFAVIWLGAFLLALVQGFFYRRAFYALAEKSGTHSFRQAGFFMFVGGVLTIIGIGALIFLVGWVFAVLGFYSIRPAPFQLSISTRLCSTCGAENPEDAVFCSRCGNKL